MILGKDSKVRVFPVVAAWDFGSKVSGRRFVDYSS